MMPHLTEPSDLKLFNGVFTNHMLDSHKGYSGPQGQLQNTPKMKGGAYMQLSGAAKYELLNKAKEITIAAISTGSYTSDSALLLLENAYKKMLELTKD